jgi:hypothetical protein
VSAGRFADVFGNPELKKQLSKVLRDPQFGSWWFMEYTSG